MRLQRLRLELGMKLAAQKVRMPRQLHNLNISRIGCGAADAQAAAGQQRFVLAVKLVAVPVALADLGSAAISTGRQLSILQNASPCA